MVLKVTHPSKLNLTYSACGREIYEPGQVPGIRMFPQKGDHTVTDRAVLRSIASPPCSHHLCLIVLSPSVSPVVGMGSEQLPAMRDISGLRTGLVIPGWLVLPYLAIVAPDWCSSLFSVVWSGRQQWSSVLTSRSGPILSE